MQRRFVSAHLAAGRRPADHITRHAKDARGVAERIAALKTVFLRHSAILECNESVLDNLQRDFVLDFLDAERSYRATQLAYRQALATYMVALEQLRQAVGTRNLP